jgi:predicted anti-sigma-YlaC factor YlaD
VIRDPHQQAQELIACGKHALADSQNAWLRAHLDECLACRDYAQSAEQFVRSLRSVPVVAALVLVRTTQMRVRLRSRELQQRRERMWLVWMSCVLVGLSVAITTPFLWGGWGWVAERAHVSSPVWQVGFVMFWLSPAVAASLLFMARGIHLTDTDGTSRG